MVGLFAGVVATCECLPANEIARVPAGVVIDRGEGFFLAFALAGGGERCERAADAVALMTSTCTQSRTRFVAEELVQLALGACLIIGTRNIVRS